MAEAVEPIDAAGLPHAPFRPLPAMAGAGLPPAPLVEQPPATWPSASSTSTVTVSWPLRYAPRRGDRVYDALEARDAAGAVARAVHDAGIELRIAGGVGATTEAGAMGLSSAVPEQAGCLAPPAVDEFDQVGEGTADGWWQRSRDPGLIVAGSGAFVRSQSDGTGPETAWREPGGRGLQPAAGWRVRVRVVRDRCLNDLCAIRNSPRSPPIWNVDPPAAELGRSGSWRVRNGGLSAPRHR